MKNPAYLLVALLAITPSCQQQRPVTPKVVEEKIEPESVTRWTNKTELFAEYPPLVAGQVSRFAVHLTRLDTFKPLTKGRVEIQLISSNGKVESFTTDGPSRPGIFGVNVKPAMAGEFQVSLRLTSGDLTDTHNLGPLPVTPTRQPASNEPPAPQEEPIAFLKEQQWTLDFATATVGDRNLKESILVPAQVMPRSGGEADVAVPFDGRLIVTASPVIGTRVTQGQILASLIPPTSAPSDESLLELARNEATLALQLAKKDRERAERLVQSGAAPAKRLDEARMIEATADARLKSAEARLRQFENSSTADANPQGAKVFAIRAPISGIIEQTRATPGANVRTGETLFRIIDVDSVYISALVPESNLAQTSKLTGAELQVPGTDKSRSLTQLITIGRVVDPQSRTFPVIYQLDNRDRSVAIQQAVQVRLLTGASAPSPAVPESAIVDDGGRPVIFIQDSGEAFIRRAVKLGMREGGYVQILEGARSGERVVTRGAHLIRLSSMSNQAPAHGHVH